MEYRTFKGCAIDVEVNIQFIFTSIALTINAFRNIYNKGYIDI